MTSQFDGKVALVTGGSSGIGAATAVAFGARGAKVVVTSRRAKESEETCERVKQAGGQALFVQADMAESAQIAQMVARTVEAFGRIDYAFNNAGITAGGIPIHAIDEAGWEMTLRVNLTGTMLCMKHEIAQMLTQGGGSIVNMASVAGLVGSVMNMPAYIASKHGIVGLTKAGALQYAKKRIRVNSVCPGWIETPLIEQGRARVPGLDEMMIRSEPMGRIGTPEEVAEAVVWLCSDAASFVTGANLSIDGGITAGPMR